MKSLADGLPPEMSKHVHPEWRKNESAYWAVRDALRAQYEGKWIAFSDGTVVASGTRPVLVLHAARRVAEHPFMVCVGREDQPYSVRTASFAYDLAYAGEPLPIVRVEYRSASGIVGVVLDRVIADTGSDTSILPWADFQLMQIDPSVGVPGLMRGIAGGSAPTFGYPAWAFLDGAEYPCQLHVDYVGNERILGRDVLNSLDVLFRGQGAEVVVNP